MSIIKTLPLAAVLFASAAGMAHAEWPMDRPVEMIVAFAPGGGTNIMLRTLVPYLDQGNSISLLPGRDYHDSALEKAEVAANVSNTTPAQ